MHWGSQQEKAAMACMIFAFQRSLSHHTNPRGSK